MKILFISQFKYPHVGGVEKHINEVSQRLSKLGYSVKSIAENDIKYPKIKIIGLLYIWIWLFKNLNLIKKSEIVHIHDVFIWYLPFKFIFPKKKIYITFHGWEGQYPIPFWNVLSKKLAAILTRGNIVVGKYIKKYYGVKSDYLIYGGVDKLNKSIQKKRIKNTITYLGRLADDTGLLEFLKFLKNKKYKVIFVGDGVLKDECLKYGKVLGNINNPNLYLKSSEFCVPSGYLSYLEAKNQGCKILTFYDNPLKKDYWKEIKKLKSIPTWDFVTSTYIKLWKK